jgi:hypothetical protein
MGQKLPVQSDSLAFLLWGKFDMADLLVFPDFLQSVIILV